MRRHGLKKGLSLLLVFCMILSLLPMTALAEEISEPSAAVEEQSPASGDTTAVDTGEDQQDEAGTGETGEAGTGENGEAGTGEAGTEAGTGETAEEEGEKSFIDQIVDGIKDILTPITGEKTEEEKAAEEAAKKAEEEEAAKKAEEEAAKQAEEEAARLAEEEAAKKAEEEAAQEAALKAAEEAAQKLAEEAAQKAAEEEAARWALAKANAVEFPTITMGTKPVDGTTEGQPFSKGTGGSSNFRIPAMVTLSDGRLVAAADARWNRTSDGYGLDTIVSRSSDNGANWSYTFANYLGDNGNEYNISSTAFIDPALAVSGSTVYMLVDLYPGGTYIGNVQKGTGFDAAGNLLLKKRDESDFGYYLEDSKIYSVEGDEEQPGYSVDNYFNLTDPNDATSNLFFSNSPFQVLATSYLYLTKSTDGGKTWSEPMMLNPQVKEDSDSFYGVGPGRGLVTSTGRIMFACYTYTNQDGNTSVIYSDDCGETWDRGEAVAEQTSEAALVEADGRIYMFTRHGGYYVSEDEGETWSKKQSVGATYNTGCQLSAITYSRTIDGKPAILLSAPSDTSSRSAGKIFVGLVNEDGSINWAYTYAVNSSDYSYSCLTELNDGSIALLYEDGNGNNNAYGNIVYKTFAISDIAPNAEIGESSNPYDIKHDEDTDVTVSVYGTKLESFVVTQVAGATPSGYDAAVTYSIVLNGGDYTGGATVRIPYSNVFDDCEEFTAYVDGEKIGSVEPEDDYFEFFVPHFSDVTVAGRAATVIDITNEENVVLTVGQSKEYTIKKYNFESDDPNRRVPDSVVVTMTVTGDDGRESTENYERVTSNPNWNTLISSNTTLKTSYYYLASDGNYYQLYVTRSSYYSRYNYSLGYYASGSSELTSVTSVTHSKGNSAVSGVILYTKSGTEGTPASTTVTFMAKGVGETTAVVGNTRYNIQVVEQPEYVNMDNTPFISGTGDYSGKKVTKLTTSVNKSYDLNLSISGSSITWSSENTSVATVDQNNGTITGVSAGTTKVICTVDGISYSIPVVVLADTYGGSYDYTCDLYVAEITNTEVVYSINTSTTMLSAQEGEAIYLGFDYPFCINFFGKEDTGYALTYMSSTKSDNLYYALYEVDQLSNLDAYNAGAIFYQRTEVSAWKSGVDDMLNQAIADGYHGTMGWTRSQNNGNISSSLTFRSEKLPTVTKEVATVNGVAYTEGMVAHVGEKVVFNVTVTQYAAQDNITYSNVTLKDNLSGAVFSGSTSSTKTLTFSNTALSQDNVVTYQVEYTITDADLDKTIVNTVDLTYTYKSAYSSGSFGGTANADAKFVAASFNPQDIVIDFGLPVVIDYSGTDAHGRYDLASGNATYGDVTVSGNKVTYTPNTVLMGDDTVYLTNTAGGVYTFKVYPATTVYYEEGFMDFVDFTGYAKSTVAQATEFVGEKKYAYGFDPAYNGGSSTVSHTSAVSNTPGSTAEFTFTGTGVDIYADCTTNSGTLLIQVYDGGSLKKMLTVNTAMVKGTTDVTSGEKQAQSANNVPIASIEGLSVNPREYDVVITHVGGTGTVELDGFRVHGTLFLDTEAYKQDGESNILLQELRDAVLKIQLNATAESSDLALYKEQLEKLTDSQIYKAAVISDGISGVKQAAADADSVKDLVDNGPKNEVYLAENETLVFTVSTSRNVQVGVKVLSGTGTCSINSSSTKVSETDMFYTVTPSTDGGTVTIKNTGSGTLAITELKFTDLKSTT